MSHEFCKSMYDNFAGSKIICNCMASTLMHCPFKCYLSISSSCNLCCNPEGDGLILKICGFKSKSVAYLLVHAHIARTHTHTHTHTHTLLCTHTQTHTHTANPYLLVTISFYRIITEGWYEEENKEQFICSTNKMTIKVTCMHVHIIYQLIIYIYILNDHFESLRSRANKKTKVLP